MNSLARNNLVIPAWASLTANALEISGSPTIDEAEGLAYVFSVIDDKSNWFKGDLLLYVESQYGEDAYQIIPENAYADHHKVWQKARWICDRFPPSRRRTALSFSHHELAAKFDEAEQDYWLNMAEREQMSVSELRRAIRGENGDERVSWQEKYARLEDYVRRAIDALDSDSDAVALLRAGLEE